MDEEGADELVEAVSQGAGEYMRTHPEVVAEMAERLGIRGLFDRPVEPGGDGKDGDGQGGEGEGAPAA